MNGYNGKVLRVNLATGEWSVEEPPEGDYRRYLGGRGFILPTLLKEVPQGADPLGPENRLIFALGPLTGTPVVGGGRNSIGAKSPLTGGFGESEAGGFWGAELKWAGFDAIIVENVSAKPVYLWIKDGAVEIRDASSMWGREVAEAEKAIKRELGDERICTAIIGPAGENLVRYAAVFNDLSHAAGRMGLGAVMGSKKLKAIAVRGTKPPAIADRKKILDLSRWMAGNFKGLTHLWKYGTGSAIVLYEKQGNLPIRNFMGGRFPEGEQITSQAMLGKGLIAKMDGCFACPIRCKKKMKMEMPWKVDSVYGGPEYETLAAFGSNCGISQVEALIKAHELCGRYGMDTMSAGVSVSFAMECFERGILTLADTDGLPLAFGNAEAMLAMIERIALRKGLGDILAEGVKRASEKIGRGSEKYAMHVKGGEIPMHEPRYKQGMGLHFSVHVGGPDHCSGPHDDLITASPSAWESIDFAEPMPSTELSPRKARMVYHVGLWRHLGNYLGLCNFVPWTYQQITEIAEGVTGWPMSYWKLMKAVERGITLGRVFNLREGFSTKDDHLPERFSTSPPEGPLADVKVDPDRLQEAKKVYYQMLGWDDCGVPTYGRMVELGIDWACDFLKKP
jgi:aldehyde:ferredoxin oxidoreductase